MKLSAPDEDVSLTRQKMWLPWAMKPYGPILRGKKSVLGKFNLRIN
jgi:hypothetical protein